jgi:hypothetical protein
MERNLVGFCGLLVAIGLACQPTRAGDLKSTTRSHETKEVLVAPKAHELSFRSEMFIASEVRPFAARSSASTEHGSNRNIERENATDHKPLTLFHINSKLGNIAVEPVMGQVNGAQFSLGF